MLMLIHRQRSSGEWKRSSGTRRQTRILHEMLLNPKDFVVHFHYMRSVKSETGGSIRQHVGVHRICNVGLPVGNRSLLCSEGLENATQPGEHRKTAMLEFFDLKLLKISGFGKPQGVKATAGSN